MFEQEVTPKCHVLSAAALVIVLLVRSPWKPMVKPTSFVMHTFLGEREDIVSLALEPFLSARRLEKMLGVL